MPQQVRGVIARKPGAPVELTDVIVPHPGQSEVVVAVARLAGASTIIAVDRDEQKLAWATDLGATHTVKATTTDTVAAVQELTGGFGADVVIDAVGRPETWKQAFDARDLAGTVVLVGVPTPQMRLDEVEQAFHTIREGKGLRSVVVL